MGVVDVDVERPFSALFADAIDPFHIRLQRSARLTDLIEHDARIGVLVRSGSVEAFDQHFGDVRADVLRGDRARRLINIQGAR